VLVGGGEKVAPLDDPLSYPGTRPDHPFLLVEGHTARIAVAAGRPLADASVGTTGQTLGDVLATCGASAVAARQPVLAVGSNANPAQLSAKFRGHDCGDAVIGLIVQARNVTVRPSAHLSRRGYWPFAPASSEELGGQTIELVLCLLDEAQIAVLDRTEPNYDHRQLNLAVHPIRPVGPAPAEPLQDVALYVSRHGVVDDPRLPVLDESRQGSPPPSQTRLLTALLACLRDLPTGVRTPEELLAEVRRDPNLPARITAAMPEVLRTRPADLALL
jgi:hypothetical protein